MNDIIIGSTDNSDEHNKVSRLIVEHAVIVDESSDIPKPFTSTTCSLASKVREQRIDEITTQQTMKNDSSFDNVLGQTTHKSDGKQTLIIYAYNIEHEFFSYVLQDVFYLINFNFYVFFTMSCRLEELVDTIIT
jgi:hypothetical protein